MFGMRTSAQVGDGAQGVRDRGFGIRGPAPPLACCRGREHSWWPASPSTGRLLGAERGSGRDLMHFVRSSATKNEFRVQIGPKLARPHPLSPKSALPTARFYEGAVGSLARRPRRAPLVRHPGTVIGPHHLVDWEIRGTVGSEAGPHWNVLQSFGR